MSKRSKNKKQQQEPSKPVNYSLFNQKITFEFLKSHLWAAADILRGSLDPADYRQPIMTLLFIKRLNDTFEENKFFQRHFWGITDHDRKVTIPKLIHERYQHI
jgi:hypothetical protein